MYVKLMSKLYELTMDECPICLEPMVVGLVLPCKHIFHEACIESWKDRNDSCPICRVPLTPVRIPWWRHCWFIYTRNPQRLTQGTR